MLTWIRSSWRWLLTFAALIVAICLEAVAKRSGVKQERKRQVDANEGALAATVAENAATTTANVELEQKAAEEHAAIDARTVAAVTAPAPTTDDADQLHKAVLARLATRKET